MPPYPFRALTVLVWIFSGERSERLALLGHGFAERPKR